MNDQTTTTGFGPLHTRPKGLWPPYENHLDPHAAPGARKAACVAALEDALRGLELGEHDRKVLYWLAGDETSTVATVIAWVERARRADAREVA